MAMAIADSVTVSMAAETTGVLSVMLREKRLRIETSLGMTEEKAGTSSTSSYVSPKPTILSLEFDICNYVRRYNCMQI